MGTSHTASLVSFTLAAALFLGACSGEESESDSSTQTPVTAAGAGATDVDWSLHGNDWGEQRHSSLDRINRENVGELGLAWYFDMYTDRGVEATPLMVNDTLYVTSSWSLIYALDARSGELKWFHDPRVPREFLAKGCCDAVNRGVAYAEGRILASTYDGRLLALDAASGELLWDVQTTDREQSYTISGAPRVVGDKVIIGNGGAELGVRGYVTAYAIATGERVWRFWTVPGNPADGFENAALEKASETWNGEWWKWGGGGTAWDSLVFDPELNLVYIGVGNGSPWNQKLRSPGGGDNLFLASIVAVNADTGEYVWHYQTAPGDTWDYTATQHMMLADIEWQGETRKVLMQAPKNGFFYVLDRASGELLSAEPFVKGITWASHIDMQSGRPVETASARVFDGKNLTIPSNAGGHNWPAMARNPETGLVYIPTMNTEIQFKEPTAEWDTEPNRGYFNQGFDRTDYAPPNIPNLSEVIDQTYTGQLVAWDPVEGAPRWTGELGRVSGGGVLSTAGGLVFQGHHDKFRALDAASGDLLWSADVQTGAMAPPISYALDGEQYVALAVGFGGGLAAEAGPVANHWDLGNVSRVLVYKLGGDVRLPRKESRKTPFPEPLPVTAGADTVELGKALYQRHCSVCHGDGGLTGGLTPDLRKSTAGTHEAWEQIVLGGLLRNAGMVSFAEFLDATEAEAIRQYVLSQANAAWELQQAAAEQGEAPGDR